MGEYRSVQRRLRIEDLIETYDGIIQDADVVLKESRIASSLPLPGMPEGLQSFIGWSDHNDPLPPEDMTYVPDLIIGKLFSFFQNWTNYISAESTRAKLMRDVQDRHLSVVKSALSIHYREEVECTVAMIPDYIAVDERFVAVDAALLRIKVFHETAKDRYDQLKRVLNNISREQTRRKDELERTLHDEAGGRDKQDRGLRGRPRRRMKF